jgi:hypothetical protein
MSYDTLVIRATPASRTEMQASLAIRTHDATGTDYRSVLRLPSMQLAARLAAGSGLPHNLGDDLDTAGAAPLALLLRTHPGESEACSQYEIVATASGEDIVLGIVSQEVADLLGTPAVAA